MFPTETSLIPTTVVLAKFVEANGLGAVFENYPYWYLGSTPFRYLTGPIVPLLSVLFHKLFLNVSLFSIVICFVVLSFVAGAFGWGMLVSKIRGGKLKLESYLLIILLLFLPWRLFSALSLSDASMTIARNLLPFGLLAFWAFLNNQSRKNQVLVIFTISLLLLTSTSILAILVVGMVSLLLAKTFRKGKIRNIAKYLKPSFYLLVFSFLLVTLAWYPPGYWWTLLTNPSIGGASGIKVIMRVFDLLKAFVPLGLAIFSVYFMGKIKSRLSVFALTWTFTFLFLTIFRFIGDPDFWMDWTTWLYEVEIGIVLIVTQILNPKFEILNKSQITSPKLQTSSRPPAAYFLLLTLLILPFYLTWRIYLILDRPKLISSEIPIGIASLEKLSEIAGDSRVFLSGSTVFWSGSVGLPINQVRGGNDRASTHSFWHHGAYQIREGSDPELTKEWLDRLEVSYVLVHTRNSSEYYHDFEHLDKWGDVGEKAWEESGDIIYKI